MKLQKYITNDAESLSIESLRAIIQKFQSTDLPVLKNRYNYYIGKHKILFRTMGEGKPNNHIVTNFIHAIVDNFSGYGMGLPVSYSGEGTDTLIEQLKYNDVNDEDKSLYRDGLIYGRGCEIHYIDIDGKSRFRTVQPTEVIPVVSNDLDETLLFVIRLYQTNLNASENPIYRVEVYNNTEVIIYESGAGFQSFTPIMSYAHHYNQVPWVIYESNQDSESVAEQVYSLQDCYNSLISDSINDWDAFCDAYLVLTGVQASAEDLKAMKENRCLLLDTDSKAEFLTKATNTTEIENLLTTVETKIWQMSDCVNFADESFGTASGVALRYRLLNMENKTSDMLSAYKKAIQKRIELLCSILRLKGEDVWRDVIIIFKRNLPADLAENSTVVMNLQGIVSNETLLGLLPFVVDAKEEAEKAKKEKEDSMELYQLTQPTANKEE